MAFNAGWNVVSGEVATAAKFSQLGENDDFLKAKVDQNAPVGAITGYIGVDDPTGWLIANGRNVSRSTYSALFAKIGTTFGAGDGTSTFALPNLQGRTIVGVDGSVEHPSVGALIGAKYHQLTWGQMPSHDHGAYTTSAGTHQHNYVRGAYEGRKVVANTDGIATLIRIEYTEVTPPDQGHHGHSIQVLGAGGNEAHNNLQPSFAANWIIKV